MSETGRMNDGIKAGLIRVSHTAATEPRGYCVIISNGSGTKSTVVTATRQSSAAAWANGWAASLPGSWSLVGITEAQS